MTARPPDTTLFPYTTLFRSLVVAARHVRGAVRDGHLDGHREGLVDLRGRHHDRLGGARDEGRHDGVGVVALSDRSEEHTSELQSPCNIVCHLLIEKKKKERN